MVEYLHKAITIKKKEEGEIIREGKYTELLFAGPRPNSKGTRDDVTEYSTE